MKGLLLNALQASVSGFIFSSSQAVYGTTKPSWSESGLVSPVTSYGWSKFAGEQILRMMTSCRPSIKGISLRLPKLVGPGHGFRMHMGEWLHTLAYAAIHDQEIIISQQFLDQQFDFMDVRDAARICIRILEMAPSSWPETLNIGSGQFISGKQLIVAIDTVMSTRQHSRLRYKIRPHAGNGRDFGMEVTALRNYLGNFSCLELSETIGDVCSYIHDSASKPTK